LFPMINRSIVASALGGSNNAAEELLAKTDSRRRKVGSKG